MTEKEPPSGKAPQGEAPPRRGLAMRLGIDLQQRSSRPPRLALEAVARPSWQRSLLRSLLGTVIATVAGWLCCVLLAAIVSVAAIVFGGQHGQPFNFVVIVGMFGAILGVPVALPIGVPVWFVAEQAGYLSIRTGVLFGALVGLVIGLLMPFLIFLLPPIGALSGFLAVRYTNHWLPPTARRAKETP